MSKFSFEEFDFKHYHTTERYAKVVRELYEQAAKEIAAVAAKENFNPDKPFSFKDYPKTARKLKEILNRLAKQVEVVIKKGTEEEWVHSFKKNSAWLQSFVGATLFTQEQLQAFQSRRLEGLKAFQDRKIRGMGLKDRIWKQTEQYQKELEHALDVGLGEGRSAAQLSRDVRQNLRDPNRLFRRVRDKHGNLHLSKNAKAFKPGRGVYRSSYKNAMRLTRTEINMAYRESDWQRWQKLDFVLGYEIRRSNHEPLCECSLCERLVGKYPKWFKFVGWHPQCMCVAIPILEDYSSEARHKDRVNKLRSLLYGEEYKKYVSKNTVRDLPEGFKQWVEENKDRQDNWASTPYFIRDNFKNGRLEDGLSYNAGARHTAEERADIQRRWNTRVATRRYGDLLSKYADKDGVLGKYATSIRGRIAEGMPIGSVEDMIKELNRKIDIKARWDDRVENNHLSKYLDNVAEYKAQFGSKAMETVYKSVEAKLAQWNKLSLAKQLEKLEFEIGWVEKNKKYKTWQVARDAYKKRLAGVQLLILEKEVDSLIAEASLLKPKSNSKLAALLNSKVISKEYIERVTKEMNALTARRNRAVKSDFPSISKDEIKRLLELYEAETVDEADGRLRGTTKKVWKTLSLEERNVLTKYTQTYSYLNEPLRGIAYLGDASKAAEFKTDLPVLTGAIAKSQAPHNMIVRRGTYNWTIKELGYGLDELKVGDVFVDKGFLSTAVHRDKGFTLSYNLIIVVPKGAQGIYAEPFSHYTDYKKFTYNDDAKQAALWNGKSKELIRSEQEWIGQRGSKFRVLKKTGNTIFLELIGQLK